MRTDVKIGIAVGLLALLVVVVYLVATSKDNTTPDQQAANNDGKRESNKIEQPSPLPVTPTPRPMVSGTVTTPTPTPPPSVTGTVATPSPYTPAPPTMSASTYVVVEGDSFWAIAAKVYGNGRHHELISKANPTASSGGLHAGQTLTIPPLPRTETTATFTGSTGGRFTGTTGASGNTYVVKTGDSYWGISEKTYGSPSYADLIAKANPTVSASALKPGTTITLPPRPAGLGGATTRPATPRTASRPVTPPARTSPVPVPVGKPDFGPL